MARPPEVEPLGEARWARIEQSLMEKLDELPSAGSLGASKAQSRPFDRDDAPRSRISPNAPDARRRSIRVWPVALVASFAVAAAAAVALRITGPHPSLSSSRVVTEASASHVTIADNSLDVSPESGIEIREEEHATVLTLERGEVALHVAPREKDRPFLVEAGDVHVRVVGTEFTVRRVGIGATVAVRHGVVEVREHGELAVLNAGDHWPSEAGTATPTATPVIAPVPNPPLTPNLTPNATPTPTLAPTLAPTPTPTPTPTSASAPAPHATRSHTASTSPPTPPPPSLPLSVPPQDTSPPPPAEPTAQSKYETAAQLERTDPARALRLYLDLARGSDPWAQNALYAAGRLQADRRARGDAARLLEEYLRRFPSGSNAQDARALRESLR